MPKLASNNHENTARRKTIKPKRFGWCDKIADPQPVLMPNGMVYLCCMDFALDHPVGNLLAENFEDLTTQIKKSNGYALCHFCSQNISINKILIQRTETCSNPSYGG